MSASIPRTSFAGYIPAEAPSLASPHVSNSTGLRGVGSDYFQKDVEIFNCYLTIELICCNACGNWEMIFQLDYLQVNLLRMGAYGVDDTLVGSRVHSEASVVPTGHNIKGYSPLEDPDLSKKQDTPLAINPAVADISNERPVSKSDYDGLQNSAGESNILFVGGLPNDCTRREVGRILCCIYVRLYACAYQFSFHGMCIMDRKRVFSKPILFLFSFPVFPFFRIL